MAVLDTLLDLNTQVIAATLQANKELPSGSSFGGLHGGYARLTKSKAVLEDFSFVPGVTLTATFPVHDHRLALATIKVAGKLAAAGIVRFGDGSTFATGALDGRRFDVPIATVKLARRGGGEWPSLAALAPTLGRDLGAGSLSPARLP